jgi:hypothetical protein
MTRVKFYIGGTNFNLFTNSILFVKFNAKINGFNLSTNKTWFHLILKAMSKKANFIVIYLENLQSTMY